MTSPPDLEPERPTKRPKISQDQASINVQDKTKAEIDGEESEDEQLALKEPAEPRASDLYLDTVNRTALDFDFEKLCSISLSNINIYGCLVCGKYFQGRGRNSYAYAHSIHDDHHVFINLESQLVYVLPDGYLVKDPSLDDISAVLNPTFTAVQVAALSKPFHHAKPAFDLTNKSYLPGYVGLNNIKANDYLNVVIHALLHVRPLRDYLLLRDFPSIHSTTSKATEMPSSELLRRFAGLARKVWNPRLFKSQVSPHEFLQEVSRVSSGKFKITEQGILEVLENGTHVGTVTHRYSVIYSTFQGELRMETQHVIVKADEAGNQRPTFDIGREIKSVQSPFLFLALDLPPPPLFQDAVEKNIIPQVTLASVLAKYDGKTTQEFAGELKRYRCTRLPPYIVVHYKRFTKNNFVEEKNPTIVNFPIRGADFRDVLESPPAGQLTVYDLVANVTHESTAGTTRDKKNTVWKVHVRAPGEPGDEQQDRWLMMQDLIIEETARELIFLGETVLQIWERRTV